MNVLQALILGIVQGFTEFLPISSSAHLQIAKTMMNISHGENLFYFDLVCHTGTLISLLFFLRKEIFLTLCDMRMLRLLALGIAPLVPVYFLLKPLRIAASDPSYLGYFLLCTSLLLFIAARPPKQYAYCPQSGYASIKYLDVLWIGIMQTMALLPGISRSGSTIAAARLLGWDWNLAARFSFLLAIPAILGGQVLETAKLFTCRAPNETALPLSCYLAGFSASLIVGMIGVRFIFKIYEKGSVLPFAWYCLALGTAMSIYG